MEIVVPPLGIEGGELRDCGLDGRRLEKVIDHDVRIGRGRLIVVVQALDVLLQLIDVEHGKRHLDFGFDGHFLRPCSCDSGHANAALSGTARSARPVSARPHEGDSGSSPDATGGGQPRVVSMCHAHRHESCSRCRSSASGVGRELPLHAIGSDARGIRCQSRTSGQLPTTARVRRGHIHVR